MPPSVAIIMRSKNEMPHIQATLAMLQQQTFNDFEFFAIDSGSTDGSVELLKSHCAADRLAQIEPQDYEPGKVLNDAIARTRNPIVVLLNADARPLSDDWLEHLVEPIRDGVADATFSRQVARPGARFIVAYDYERAYNPANIQPGFFSAVACAFKRELWEKHPFRSHGYAEDAIWAMDCATFGATFQLAPKSNVEHSHNYTFRDLFDKKYRQGQSFANNQGRVSPLRNRLYLCGRELVRDLLFACRQKQFHTIPYNIAYRVTIHAGLHQGIQAGCK